MAPIENLFYLNLPSMYWRRSSKLVRTFRFLSTAPIPSMGKYHRQVLTKMPTKIIGNLDSVRSDIELSIWQYRKTSIGNTKENIPFFVVVSTPRMGKSALLELLFNQDENVINVPVSYNSVTPILDEEIQSVDAALRYFWLRVLKSLGNFPASLSDLSRQLGDRCIDWGFVKNVINNRYVSSPLLNKHGKEKSVLFCVDEFSKLTDCVKELWSESDQRRFMKSLHVIKQAGKEVTDEPFVQFVVTGFNNHMTSLMSTSSILQPRTLDQCELEDAKELLVLIAAEYARAKRVLPVSLFQLMKHVPGLLGAWLERVQSKEFDTGIDSFCGKLPWLSSIMSRNIALLWSLLIQRMLEVESGVQSEKLATRLIETEIAFKSNNNSIVLNPICTYRIVQLLDEYSQSFHLTWQKDLSKAMREIIDHITTVTRGKDKSGQHFESFVLSALRVRLLLRQYLQHQEKDEQHQQQQHQQHQLPLIVSVPRNSLLPADVVRVADVSFLGNPLRIYFQGVSSREQLSEMLLQPLYHLFPTDVDTLLAGKMASKSGAAQWMTKTYPTVADDSDDYDSTFTMGVTLEKRGQIPLVVPFNGEVTEKQAAAILSRVKQSMLNDSTKKYYEVDLHANSFGDEFTADEQARMCEFWTILRHKCQILSLALDDRSLGYVGGPKSGEGMDLFMMWREQKVLNAILKQREELVHVAAVELRDSSSIKDQAWIKKRAALTGVKSVLMWTVLLSNHKIVPHVVFIDRKTVL